MRVCVCVEFEGKIFIITRTQRLPRWISQCGQKKNYCRPSDRRRSTKKTGYHMRSYIIFNPMNLRSNLKQFEVLVM